MKYFAIEGTFKNPIPVDQAALDKAIKEHIAHLQKGFDEGWILISGPKAYSGGGIIIMKANSLEEVQNYLSNDPLKVSGVQEYNIVEFKFHESQPEIREWFNA